MIALARHPLLPAEAGPALRALCAWALVRLGARAVAVATPAANEAAAALYRSVGFAVVREARDWVRA